MEILVAYTYYHYLENGKQFWLEARKATYKKEQVIKVVMVKG